MSSAKGGYLNTALPDEVALRNFMQEVFVGITGLQNTFVRPRFQLDPPPMPEPEVNWLSFDIRERRRDANAVLQVVPDDETKSDLIRHEEFSTFCSFYGPSGAGYAELLLDGLELAQNRERLLLNGFGFVDSQPTQFVPEQIDERWFSRTDVSIRFRREISKRYEILCFVGANGEIITEKFSIPVNVEATNP